jgi:hypothetical protein
MRPALRWALPLANVAVVGAWLAYVTDGLREVRPDSPIAAAPRALGQLALPGLPSTARWEGAPLFAASRRPPAVPVAAAATLAVSPPPRLIGIVRDRAHGRVALVEDSEGSRRRLTAVGQHFDGWTVVHVQGNRARLRPPGARSPAGDLELDLIRPEPAP